MTDLERMIEEENERAWRKSLDPVTRLIFLATLAALAGVIIAAFICG